MAGMVSGLSSGLDTAGIVSQLIAVERNSQTLVKSKLSTEQSNVKSLQDINAKLSSLATLSQKLSKPDAWNPVKVTSSSDKVTATGTPTTTTGIISFTVDRLATAHTVSFPTGAKLKDPVASGDPSSVRLTVNGVTKEINAGDGSLTELVNALNGSGTGVRAGLVRVQEGATPDEHVYRLRITSAETGASTGIELIGSDDQPLLGGAATVTQGEDAQITVDGLPITSKSNTLSGVLNGLDVTLKPGSEKQIVDLSVDRDADAVLKNVKELVDNVNSLLADMDKATAYAAGGTTATKRGTLAGDSQVRSVRNALLEAVYPKNGTSMADVGIQTDRYGKLVLDETKFKAAVSADPAKVAAAFTAGPTATDAGFAERVRAVAKGASDYSTGTITSAINGRKSAITRLETSIADWDLRLELREKTLTRQFTAMETALSQLNGQSAWLTAQLSKSKDD